MKDHSKYDVVILPTDAAKAEKRRVNKAKRRAHADAQPPAAEKDRGPWLVNGMTMEERLNLGVEGIEPVEIISGSGHATVNVLRRRFLHPLDLYLSHNKFGPSHHRAAQALHVAGMALHEDFLNAQAMAKVSSGYEPRGSGGVAAYSDSRLAARKRINLLFRGTLYRDGTVEVAPLLHHMDGRVALHVCCMGEGTSSFDRHMKRTSLLGWMTGRAMVHLVSALKTMAPFYQARR